MMKDTLYNCYGRRRLFFGRVKESCSPCQPFSYKRGRVRLKTLRRNISHRSVSFIASSNVETPVTCNI
ncbi:hypothetical protein BABINDRAFT_147069 [Babjeviella inositovora NRRL Y-12698]|uniref:Uncharacterized protein n=1 Tax=Babjeviella inositovora NRRL Y-12698 TaxID=984486 RepID=A0A1E3QNK4_9ASCO|nr:uncharacterized protein BABINDRAFT_147069 [Babjeviella inositovora NRRL Y-12698]ODQ79024.1 hypothetical protein BABINDRAFT_147069 [Babjeviella inositovora NRRL Y-12698]